MIKASDFVKTVDKIFWDHITTETTYKDAVVWKDIDKDSFLRNLANKLNTYEHSFHLPEYIFFSKNLGILRRVKSYDLRDTCIYYYCLKNLQTEIVSCIKSVPNIFGGFRLSPDLKLTKFDLSKLKFDPLYETFAKNNYRVEWSDYQNLAKALLDRDFDFYIHIDIAHFYDDINLDLLEKKLRDVTTKGEIVDLLFYFLRNSDKRDLGYISSNTGVPQEEVGEMSRLLANFYLHNFDKTISPRIEQVLEHGNFIFTRYADDMWISFNGDELSAQRITQTVSAELLKIKLHINEKKLRFYTKEEFNIHWNFAIWDEVFSVLKAPKKVLLLIKKCYVNKNGRWFSPFLYLLKSFTSNKKNALLVPKSDASYFLDMLLSTPQLAFKTSNIPYPFFLEFFSKFSDQKKRLVKLIEENKFVHPHTEYFVIALLSKCCTPLDETFELLFQFYFKATKRYPQWYSRVICISFFIEHISFLKSDKTKRDKLLTHLGNSTEFHNEIERRYNLRLIHELSTSKKAKDLIRDVYNYPKDLKFLDYLS